MVGISPTEDAGGAPSHCKERFGIHIGQPMDGGISLQCDSDDAAVP